MLSVCRHWLNLAVGLKGGNGKMLIEKNKAVIETVIPTDAMKVPDKLLNEGQN